MKEETTSDYLRTCFKKDPDVVWRKIADEFVLVPVRRKLGDLENLFTLNEVGARIWEVIDGKKKVWEIKRILCREFKAEETVMEKDLIEFLQQLEKIGMIEQV